MRLVNQERAIVEVFLVLSLQSFEVGFRRVCHSLLPVHRGVSGVDTLRLEQGHLAFGFWQLEEVRHGVLLFEGLLLEEERVVVSVDDSVTHHVLTEVGLDELLISVAREATAWLRDLLAVVQELRRHHVLRKDFRNCGVQLREIVGVVSLKSALGLRLGDFLLNRVLVDAVLQEMESLVGRKSVLVKSALRVLSLLSHKELAHVDMGVLLLEKLDLLAETLLFEGGPLISFVLTIGDGVTTLNHLLGQLPEVHQLLTAGLLVVKILLEVSKLLSGVTESLDLVDDSGLVPHTANEEIEVHLGVVKGSLQVNLDLLATKVGVPVLEHHEASLISVTESKEAVAEVFGFALSGNLDHIIIL